MGGVVVAAHYINSPYVMLNLAKCQWPFPTELILPIINILFSVKYTAKYYLLSEYGKLQVYWPILF